MQSQFQVVTKDVLGSLRYLLNQSIRQYDIPAEHHHLSRGAHDRWTKLTTANIKKYHYQNKVKCDNLPLGRSVKYKLYIGNSSTGTDTIMNNEFSFPFRQMFHKDHVIPVSMILDEMKDMVSVNESSIKTLLDKMHICVILKDEDRKLPQTKGRTLDFGETIKIVYEANGIKLYL